MSKNKKTYLLLVVVLGIWGFLGIKFVSAIGSNDEPVLEEQAIAKLHIPDKPIKRDSIIIKANYRDPFLGTLPKAHKPKKKKVVKQVKKAEPKKNIVFSGSVAGQGKSARMFFVTINGQQHIMNKGDQKDGVKLLSGNDQSIKVSYPGHRETIALK